MQFTIDAVLCKGNTGPHQTAEELAPLCQQRKKSILISVLFSYIWEGIRSSLRSPVKLQNVTHPNNGCTSPSSATSFLRFLEPRELCLKIFLPCLHTAQAPSVPRGLEKRHCEQAWAVVQFQRTLSILEHQGGDEQWLKAVAGESYFLTHSYPSFLLSNLLECFGL